MLVTSWRDTTSEQVRDDLDRLLTTVLPFAEEMLTRHGQFYPYGAAITTTGDEQMFAADVDEEDPNPSAVLTSLVTGMSSDAAELRAAALVSDVTGPRSDAIMVHLEHSDSMAITVLVPYHRKARDEAGDDAGDDIDYDAMIAQPAEAMIWRRSLC